jgi:hypothetical protein
MVIGDDELERMWKEAVVAYFKVLSRHSPGGTEENTKTLSQDSLAELGAGYLPNTKQEC